MTRQAGTQRGGNISQKEEKTYRSEEKLLGQAFYAERWRKFDWTLGQIQGMCARALGCKSKMAGPFE